MEWFFNWWGSMDLIQQSFACVAVPATIILILQTILLLFGLGGHAADHGDIDHDIDHGFDHDFDHAPDHDFDHDFDHDQDLHHDGAHHAAGARLFTVRGFVAMFAVGGWLGIAMIDLGVPPWGAALIAIVGGFLALCVVALILRASYNLQEDGNFDLRNAVAQTARVYIRIPPARSGTGKITFNLQDRYVEMEAMTDSTESIPRDAIVQIVSVTGGVLLVRPLSNQ